MVEVKLRPSLFTINMLDPSTQPATAALERMNRGQERQNKRARLRSSSNADSSTKGGFDMGDLVLASKPVEDSLPFPLIEWSTDEDRFNWSDVKSERMRYFQSSSEPKRLASRKRNRQAMSTRRLVRSIALDSHLCLLETSFENIHKIRSSCSISSNSSNSNCSTKFNVDDWITELSDFATGSDALSDSEKSLHEVLPLDREANRLHNSLIASPLTT